MTELENALTSFISPYLQGMVENHVYCDKSRLKGGDYFNEKLTRAIRRSVCMVCVLTPAYFASPYCRRELGGMFQVEEQRHQAMGIDRPDWSFIVPIHFVGSIKSFPSCVKDLQIIDFTRCHLYNMRGSMLEHDEFGPKAQEIAEKVYHCYERMRPFRELFQPGGDPFELPDEEEVHDLRINFSPAMPFR